MVDIIIMEALGPLVDIIIMEALVAILVDLMEVLVVDLGENMVDTSEVLGRSMVEALGDMVADLALMAFSRTCLMTRMLMTTLLVLIWRKRKMIT